jgi:hypothetical protein
MKRTQILVMAGNPVLAADIAKIQRPLRHVLKNDQAIMVDD